MPLPSGVPNAHTTAGPLEPPYSRRSLLAWWATPRRLDADQFFDGRQEDGHPPGVLPVFVRLGSEPFALDPGVDSWGAALRSLGFGVDALLAPRDIRTAAHAQGA
jgi:hypothetical protein